MEFERAAWWLRCPDRPHKRAAGDFQWFSNVLWGVPSTTAA